MVHWLTTLVVLNTLLFVRWTLKNKDVLNLAITPFDVFSKFDSSARVRLVATEDKFQG